MLPAEARLGELRQLIDNKAYFVIHAPARQLVERLVPDRAVEITALDVEVAKEVLIRRRDTHLDSLIDRLREDRIRRVIEPVLTGSYPRAATPRTTSSTTQRRRRGRGPARRRGDDRPRIRGR